MQKPVVDQKRFKTNNIKFNTIIMTDVSSLQKYNQYGTISLNL